MADKSNIFENFFMQMTSALIAVDSELHLKIANELAVKLFPKLADTPTETAICQSEFHELFDLFTSGQKIYKASGRIYDVGIKELAPLDIKILWFRDVTKEKETFALLKLDQLEMSETLNEKNQFIQEVQKKVITSLADVIESRDENTGGHVKRTNDTVKLLLEAMLQDNYPGLDEKFVKIVSGCSSMHDIGKISVSDTILLKNGKLTDDEFTQMKRHAEVGGTLIDKVLDGIEDESVLRIARNIAHSHHEKWDGSGYPNRLQGEEIPLEARVMAIADVYDALVSKRCYKEPMPFPKANIIIQESFGKHFDPSLKKYFDECRSQIESYYEKANNN